MPSLLARPVICLSVQEGVDQLGQTLAGILEDSAASMKQDSPKDGAAQRKAWWKLRMGLDLRLAALLGRLDALLGPWRSACSQFQLSSLVPGRAPEPGSTSGQLGSDSRACLHKKERALAKRWKSTASLVIHSKQRVRLLSIPPQVPGDRYNTCT